MAISNTSGQFLVKGKHGIYLADVRNDMIDRSLLSYGQFDDDEAHIFSQCIEAGANAVLEVAANMGPFTPLLARLVGAEGVVHTVEPSPAVVHQLHAQLALNGITNVIVHQLAIGSVDGGAMSIEPGQHGGTGMLSWRTGEAPATVGAAGCGTSVGHVTTCFDERTGRLRHATRIATIDALKVPRVSFIKLDIEGNEFDALRGANYTLRRWRPLVYAEEHATSPAKAPSVLWLQSLDYTVYLHSFPVLGCQPEGAGKSLMRQCSKPYFERNILAVPRERAERFSQVTRRMQPL